MIIRSLTRRPGAIQSLAQNACRAPYARRLHGVPSLLNHDELLKNGVPGLFSKKQFDIAYTQYQGHIVESLNVSTSGSEIENRDAKSLIVDCARNPMMAYTFNLASMAFNNHFFFRGLNTNPNISSTPSADLTPLINRSFTSLETLQETMILTADAMFGPGFVWLVQTPDAKEQPLKLLTTYIAGSPLSGAHNRKQPADLNTQNTTSYAGSFGAASRQKDNKPKKALGGVDVIPLLCVNTWEHVWLHDYGVAGKLSFLENWWNKIDWAQVQQNALFESNKSPSAGQGFRQFHSS
ncbi:Fe superoxide dismutase-like protein [Karstenula rhodostoma CBS 690.94]|uniref:Fe superoxide dismutase-like protein n=1 Tax=Karstenula rhodostoma CBS 690.94 TaxID=1392251 RepID=A0A9P4PC05_9PLEO|nr:Fe superoxide dismutase-like protein [Karstenula rhodostoma CBS 690.94]